MLQNTIEQQFKQHEKEAYLADHIFKRLLYENCSMAECNNIVTIIQERIEAISAAL